ncbi:MAG: glycoside hydrolase family 28 protein [Verrucomicrobiota bacterium JB022]|nr:glycoside hydrolase family 28 protein [Verrucomicrobiota bacterium JB022]
MASPRLRSQASGAWLACLLFMTQGLFATAYNVRDYGAKGDGQAIDSPAINAAIEAASDAGGGTVVLPAGTYRSFSIRLQSHITLELQSGATLLAASPDDGDGRYDEPEPNKWGDELRYQDFGHSHWRNSLIWGENLENIAIVGHGLIDGEGLQSHVDYSDEKARNGHANKAIALRECRNVTLRDFSVLKGGHFMLLATGVDTMTIDNLKIDTNRDALDIDACRNVRISNCSINSLNDDAIVLKASYALGEVRHCEDITITNCLVSGYDIGSMLDATYRTETKKAVDQDGPTARIKLGTESNGDFRNITISNCVFRRSRGLAIESVDGSNIENIVVSNLVMHDVSNAPIFLRLGNRARGPEGTSVGSIRGVQISGISVHDADGRFPIILAGLPGHPIEDVLLQDIRVVSRGGITMADVAEQPEHLANHFFLRGKEEGVRGPREPFAVPLREKAYPEPSMFGLLPASVLYARHVEGLEVRGLHYTLTEDDERPLVVLHEATDVLFEGFAAQPSSGGSFRLQEVTDFETYRCKFVPDQKLREAELQTF